MYVRLPLIVLVASCASAQVASITGRVTDPSGAVVPGAAVSGRSAETGVQSVAESTSEGYYTIPMLPPGAYELRIKKEGSVTINQTGIELSVQQAARIDMTLQVGHITESVQVTAAAMHCGNRCPTCSSVKSRSARSQ